MQYSQNLVKHAVALLLIITRSYSKIEIKVKPAISIEDIVTTYTGEYDMTVTETDIRLFNITQDNLKRGIRVELGSVPRDVFLKDPTPYYNLYQEYKWMEVKRRTRVKNVEVFDIINQNISLATQSIINNATGTTNKMIGIKETVENSISSSWLDKGIGNVDIFYYVNLTYDKHHYGFKNRWRHNNFHSVTLSSGVSNVGYITLDPGQVVSVDLRAVKSILLLKVDYSAGLVGSVIASYARRYGSHYFWAPSIESIMSAAKLKNEIMSTEFIEIRSYLDPYVKIVDKYTLNPIHIIKPFHIKKPKKN